MYGVPVAHHTAHTVFNSIDWCFIEYGRRIAIKMKSKMHFQEYCVSIVSLESHILLANAYPRPSGTSNVCHTSKKKDFVRRWQNDT